MGRALRIVWALAALIVGAVGLACWPAPARAEYWVSDLGELLEHATRIEIVEVTGASPAGTAAVVRESIRGNPVGATVRFVDFHQPALSVGDRALVVCDDSVCPRAIGIDRGGWFLLQATQPMDGAEVLPGLVERSSLRALAGGRRAPDLCVRAEVALLDDGGARGTVTAHVDPSDGEGHATGSLLSGPTRVRLMTPHALGASTGADATLRLLGPGGAVAISGGPLVRRGGCWRFHATPVQPVARTRAAFAAGLAGTHASP